MKNISTIIAGIALVAVAYLYYVQFSPKGATTPEQTTTEAGQLPEDVSIAYINSDSLQANYKFITDKSEELETQKINAEAEYRSRVQGLQNEVESLRQNIGNMTPNRARAYQEELQQKEQNLMIYRDQLGQDLLAQEGAITQELYERVTAFLKDYSKQRNIQLVMYYSQASGILYAHEGMDITQDVVKQLNEAYEAENASTEPAATTPADTSTTSE